MQKANALITPNAHCDALYFNKSNLKKSIWMSLYTVLYKPNPTLANLRRFSCGMSFQKFMQLHPCKAQELNLSWCTDTTLSKQLLQKPCNAPLET